LTFQISPGVYPQITDDSQTVAAFPTSIGALSFGSRRGTLKLKYITSQQNFLNNFGNPDASFGFGHYSALPFLLQSSSLWCQRVVGTGAMYGLGVFVNNWYYNTGGLSGFWEGTDYSSVPLGSDVDSSLLNREVIDLIFDGPLVAGNTVTVTINSVAQAPVAFTVDNNTTMTAIAQAAQAAMDNVAVGGYAYVVQRQASGQTANRRIVRLITPNNFTSTVTATVGGTGTKPGVYVYNAQWLFFTQAENPGAWGNNVAVQIYSIDQGVKQQVGVSLSMALVTSNQISLTINGTTVTRTFSTDNNTTLAALCTAIQSTTQLAGFTATPVNLNAGVSANREIIITAPDSVTNIAVTNAAVTGGSQQAVISTSTLVNSVPYNGTFTLKVVEGQNLRIPNEFYTASMYDMISGFGNQLNVEFQVNQGPTPSARLRLYANPALAAGVVPQGTTSINTATGAGYLTGGADGNLPTSANIISGWNAMADPETVTIRILINGGYSTPEVQQAMVNIASTRRDCFAIIDIPSDQQDSASAANYRKNSMNVNSYYAAAYSPDIMIFDPYTGNRLFVPPSGYVAAQFAYTDKNFADWFAPAGLRRGVIPNSLGLRYNYNEGDRDLLSQAQVNGIRNYSGIFPIWGEYTLQYASSAMSSVSVVRLIIRIETSVVDTANYFVFDPNNSATRYRLSSTVNDFLTPIKRAGGLYDFLVVCDDSNNTPNVVDAKTLIMDIYVKPVLPALFIRINTHVEKTSATFTEIIQINSNPTA